MTTTAPPLPRVLGLLLLARSELARRGWHQGAFRAIPAGYENIQPEGVDWALYDEAALADSTTCRVCALGALNIASFGAPDAHFAGPRALVPTAEAAARDLEHRTARQLLTDQIRDGRHISAFNDAPDTTFEDVLALFDTTILALQKEINA